MSDIPLEQFFPLYTSSSVPGAVQRDLYNRKEFKDLTLGKSLEPLVQEGDLYNHQKIISRYLNTSTYNRLLLLHETGTGKTCSAIATAELLFAHGTLKPQTSVMGHPPVHIFAKNDGLLRTIRNEITTKCAPLVYKDETTAHLLKSKYNFETFAKFSTFASNVSDDQLIEMYDGSLLIIDEVHNLRIQKHYTAYRSFHRLLHILPTCKVLLMSATPMRDQATEIVSVLNLLLPLDQQLVADEIFDEQTLTEEGISLLKELCYDKVSYLRAPADTVPKVFKGTSKEEGFVLWETPMSSYQEQVYKEAYSKDITGKSSKSSGQSEMKEALEQDPEQYQDFDVEEPSTASGIYSHSRQASLCVFPDSLYGSEGFNTFIRPNGTHSFALEPSFRKLLKKNTVEATLSSIEHYSSKYASSIRILLQAREEGKLAFVYNNFVKGSGCILFSLLLELVGYEKYSNRPGPAPKYILLSKEVVSTAQVSALLRVFNKDSNKHGEDIQVVIGSKTVSEGYTLKNIQVEIIQTPFWNYAETEQAIGRGPRAGSHDALLEEGLPLQVDIYQMSSTGSRSSSAKTIDEQMYALSAEKDRHIKKVEKVLQQVAVDCLLAKDRNRRYAPGTRDCFYGSCEIQCECSLPQNRAQSLHTAEYNLLYVDVKPLVDTVCKALYKGQPLFVPHILQGEDEFITGKVLASLPTTINTKYGLRQIQVQNQVISTCEPRGSQDMYGAFYGSFPVVEPCLSSGLEEALDLILVRRVCSRVLTPTKLPKDTQLFLIKQVCRLKEGDAVKEFVLNTYPGIVEMKNSVVYIKWVDGITYTASPPYVEWATTTTTAKASNGKAKPKTIKPVKPVKRKPGKAVVEEVKEVKEEKDGKEAETEDRIDEKEVERWGRSGVPLKDRYNKYGWYGVKNPLTKEFCIAKVQNEDEINNDKRAVKLGKRCMNYNKGELAGAMKAFDISTDGMKKEEMCDTFETELLKKQFVFLDTSCGTSKKIRTLA